MAEQIFYAVAVTFYCAVFVWLFVCAVWRAIDEERQRMEVRSDEGGRKVGR
ncbi:hypothetical protein [Fervidibacter sacchari]